jgi:predicted alpha/beta superfamily hydrolase
VVELCFKNWGISYLTCIESQRYLYNHGQPFKTQTIKYLISSLLSILIFGIHAALSQHNKNIIIGSKFIINSSILDEDRTCLISLTDSYNDSTEVKKKYPIMILLDGSSHFKTASGILHFMSSNRNRNHFIPETIIVAIENIDRERGFTVTKIKTKRANSIGGGNNFLKFIEKELIPYVDKKYRTNPYRTLVGHSLGGLLTLNAHMDKNSL